MIVTTATLPNALKALFRILLALPGKNPVIASPVVDQQRTNICKACPCNVDGQCLHCTCLVSLKTLVATESCPLGAWGKETKFSNGI